MKRYSNYNTNEKAKRQYFQQSFHFIFTPGPKKEHVCLHAGRCLGKKTMDKTWIVCFAAVPAQFVLYRLGNRTTTLKNKLYNIYHCAYYHSKFGTTILDARHVLSTPISVFILFTCFRICQISEFVNKMSNDVKWELV